MMINGLGKGFVNESGFKESKPREKRRLILSLHVNLD
tara:strand:+ start:378 stop:488 length:111 start_codon:yes stop_codon:yes gene_type:complete